MSKILLTAFEPFGGHALNASQQVVRALQPRRFESFQLETLELPVTRFLAPALVEAALESVRPDVVILLGEAWTRSAITPERVAINLDDFAIPDNVGNQPREAAIIEGAPAAYFSTLPLAAMRVAIAREGIAAEISNTAGTYLCNHLFYRVMHSIAAEKLPIRAGFIHIPQLKVGENGAGWPLEKLVEGVGAALGCCGE